MQCELGSHNKTVGKKLFERTVVFTALGNGSGIERRRVEAWRLDARFALIRDTGQDDIMSQNRCNNSWHLLHLTSGHAVQTGHWDDMVALWGDLKYCASFDRSNPYGIVAHAEPEVLPILGAYKYKRDPLKSWATLFSTVHHLRCLSRRFQDTLPHYETRYAYRARREVKHG